MYFHRLWLGRKKKLSRYFNKRESYISVLKKTKNIFPLVRNIVYWLLTAFVFNFLGVGNTVFFEEKR